MRLNCILVTVLAAILLATPAPAAVTLPGIFSEHMVLQQGAPIAIWGTVNGPGDRVNVQFAGKTYSVNAGRHGEFLVRIPPMKAGGPYELTVSDLTWESVQFFDVLVGNVWLIARTPGSELAKPASAESGLLPCPFLRIRDAKATGEWILPSQQSAAAYSAVAYYFGRRLHDSLKVPIGLIEVAPDEVAALAPFSIRGVIWLPDEREKRSGGGGAEGLETRIRDWRKAWGQNALPALCVQTPERHLAPTDTSAVVVVDIDDTRNKQEAGRRLAASAIRSLNAPATQQN